MSHMGHRQDTMELAEHQLAAHHLATITHLLPVVSTLLPVASILLPVASTQLVVSMWSNPTSQHQRTMERIIQLVFRSMDMMAHHKKATVSLKATFLRATVPSH